MKQHILIAPVGDEMETLFPILRTFPTEKIILIANENTWKQAHDFKETLKIFRIPVEVNKVETYSIDELFQSIRNIIDYENEKNVIINVASADKVTSCFALCAAYVYGLSAVAVMNEQVMMLPIMKFSYYKTLSEPKLKILTAAYEKGNYIALEELREKTKMSPPLLSYHLNGTPEVEGLKQMELIETREQRKKVEVKLSTLGEILMAGYL
jgi:DNA-binding transcriptional ArsR family regulator